jgi:adenine-specific DNA-methyltransferase
MLLACVPFTASAADVTWNAVETKTIFEPSFGDGAFLIKIVERMLNYSIEHNFTTDKIHTILDNLYGVEKDEEYYNKAVHRLNELLKKYNIVHTWKNLICGDTLRYVAPTKFDICVANPPYQKSHHIDAPTKEIIQKEYRFGCGSTDLYVIFIEYCLNTLSDDGKLCFITPNSYFKNSSQTLLRKHLADSKRVSTIVDYSKVKVFGNIATYTAILLIDRTRIVSETKYVKMSDINTEEYSTSINLGIFGKKPWTFTTASNMLFLEEVNKRQVKLKDLCAIQHGIATNADKIYIINPDKTYGIEKELLHPVAKASTLSMDNVILFPYQWNSRNGHYEVIKEDVMRKQFPNAYQYLSEHRSVLESRDMESNAIWYQFARSQGIQNSNNKKFAIKHIISDKEKVCEFKELGPATLVYSGIYIVVKDEKKYDFVKKVLSSEDFHKYLFLVGKDMAGGYRSVSAKFIKEYGIPIQQNN